MEDQPGNFNAASSVSEEKPVGHETARRVSRIKRSLSRLKREFNRDSRRISRESRDDSQPRRPIFIRAGGDIETALSVREAGGSRIEAFTLNSQICRCREERPAFISGRAGCIEHGEAISTTSRRRSSGMPPGLCRRHRGESVPIHAQSS
jgi:hypothetical protein